MYTQVSERHDACAVLPPRCVLGFTHPRSLTVKSNCSRVATCWAGQSDGKAEKDKAGQAGGDHMMMHQ